MDVDTTDTAAAISRKATTRRRIIRLIPISMAIITRRPITRTAIITDTRHTRINPATIQDSRHIRATAIIRDSRRILTLMDNIRRSPRIPINRRITYIRRDTTIITATVTTRRNGNTAVPRTRFVE